MTNNVCQVEKLSSVLIMINANVATWHKQTVHYVNCKELLVYNWQNLLGNSVSWRQAPPCIKWRPCCVFGSRQWWRKHMPHSFEIYLFELWISCRNNVRMSFYTGTEITAFSAQKNAVYWNNRCLLRQLYEHTIFHWHNPSGRTMALGTTQSLTEMSKR